MVFWWFSGGFLWFSHGFLLVFWWFSGGFLMVSDSSRFLVFWWFSSGSSWFITILPPGNHRFFFSQMSGQHIFSGTLLWPTNKWSHQVEAYVSCSEHLWNKHDNNQLPKTVFPQPKDNPLTKTEKTTTRFCWFYNRPKGKVSQQTITL